MLSTAELAISGDIIDINDSEAPFCLAVGISTWNLIN